MRRSDDALATLALVSRLSASDVQPLRASEYWDLTSRLEAGPSSLLGKHAADLEGELGVPRPLAERIAALVDRAKALAFELERLEHAGIRSLTPLDEHYPSHWNDRLGPKAPPVLYAAGRVELLETPGLGVVGSRDVNPLGARVAIEAAELADWGLIPVVSGGARGVDQIAMNSALRSGGAAVGFLADSLSRRLARRDARPAIPSAQALMCTPYNPDAGFSIGNAMGRNRLIYAQSRLTLVVAAAANTGGTWHGAIEALDNGFGQVAVWRGRGEGPGNARLEQLGAVPITDLEDLVPIIDDDAAFDALGSALGQQELFGLASAI